MSILDSVIDDLAEGFLKGAIVRAAQGWVAQGYITADQAPALEAGAMVEIQVALKMWQAQEGKAA